MYKTEETKHPTINLLTEVDSGASGEYSYTCADNVYGAVVEVLWKDP